MNKKVSVGILVLIGFLTTIELARIYYSANFDPYALASFCSVNEFIDCDGVAKTPESQFLGIPLAYWGMFLYLFIGLLLSVEKLKNVKFLKFFEVFKNPMSYISALGLIAFTISMILFGISLFSIKKLCILCFFTYVLNLFISLAATDFKNGGYIKSFKESFLDFVDALKIKKYLIAFIAVAVCGIGFLTYTTTSMIFTPHIKRQKSLQEYVDMKTNPYKVSGNVLGDKNGTVVVDIYSDFVCPICFTQNIILHKVVGELNNVKVVHHNMPLDTQCNKYLKQPFHEGACRMARYGNAATKQNAYWGLANAMFEQQPKNDMEILNIAKSLKLNTKKLEADANSPEAYSYLESEIDDAAETLQEMATPTLLINGKKHQGIALYYELKDELIDAGATRK